MRPATFPHPRQRFGKSRRANIVVLRPGIGWRGNLIHFHQESS
jgi:hypothetical protein